jgi:hypothetical protein
MRSKQSHTDILPPIVETTKKDAHAYGLPKLHKDPVVDRPIISGINSITEAISKITDYFMKQIIPSTPTHLKDSQTFIKEIK